MKRRLIGLSAACGFAFSAAAAGNDTAVIPSDMAQLRVVTGLPAGAAMGLWAKPGETAGRPTGWAHSGDRLFLTGKETEIEGRVWVQTDYEPTYVKRGDYPWLLKAHLAPYVPAPAELKLPVSCQYWKGGDDLQFTIEASSIQIYHAFHDEGREGDWVDTYKVAAGAREISRATWSMEAEGDERTFTARLVDTQICRTSTGLQPQRYEYEDTTGVRMCCDPVSE